MGRAGTEKKKEIDSNKKIFGCLYDLRIKVEEAVSRDIHYATVSRVEDASWKMVSCLVEHKLVKEIVPSEKPKKFASLGKLNCDNDDDEEDGFAHETQKSPKAGKGKKKKKPFKDANKKINDCLYDLSVKVDEASNKNLCFTKISEVDEVSWKVIDCLVKDEIVDESVQPARKLSKTKRGSPDACYSQEDKKRTPVSTEGRRLKSPSRFHQANSFGSPEGQRLKSPSRIHQTNNYGSPERQRLKSPSRIHQTNNYGSPEGQRLISPSRIQQTDFYGSPGDCQKRLEFNGDEDGYKVAAAMNPNVCEENGTYYKFRVSVLEKQKLDLEKALKRLDENYKTLNRNEKHYALLANDYINKFRELKNATDRSRMTNVCPNCEAKKLHMNRYKAERDNLQEDKNRLEKHLTHLAGERNDLTRQLQKIQMENNKFIELVKSLETQIRNAEPDETSCLTTKSLENTIKDQKKLILEIQKRLIQLQNALNEAEQATKETKNMLNECREDKNAVKSTLLERELENDKLHFEEEQLNQRLKMQREHAEEQINKLKKKLKEKEKDLQQSKQINDELNKNLVEIERNRTEFTVRERNELIQQQKNNEILNKENEALKTEMYELENKQAEEKSNIEHKFKVEINNLQSKNKRLTEKFKEAERDLEETKSKSKEQQAIFNSKQSQFEKQIKALRSQLKSDEKLKSTECRWSRSANPSRAHAYELEEEGFLDMNGWKRGPSSLPENYASVGGRSDTEKENISLKTELTVALDSIEKLKQEYSDLSEKYETRKIATQMTIESLQREKDDLEQEKSSFRAKLDQIQIDLNRYKNEQVHQQDSSHETIENLLQQNSKLDKDRGLLRTKIFSLENDKVKLEDALNKSKEDNKKLQREQDNLQDFLREKSNELKDSEVRLRKFEANILFLQNTKTENEKLKESLHEIEKVKREFEDLEKRYKRETSDRMSSDNISTKYKEENDRLRKERNSARIELQRVLREKNDSYQNLNAEQVLAREELQTKVREKSELVALFKDKENKDLQKIKLYEKEIETLKSRVREDNEKVRQSEHEIETLKSRLKDDDDKIQRFENEIYTLKSSCRDDDKVQQLEHENETLNSRCRDYNEKMRQSEREIESLKSRRKDDNDKIQRMEREIENLKSRLTGEKANQYSAYEMLQNKNDLETCRHQKKALEDERNELQKENNELENELQSLNSKLEQFEDSVRNISNLKKQIKDHEEGYRNITSKLHEAERQMGKQKETIEDQKQENREIYKEKKDLENKLRLALNNEEQASLGKECEDLKILLQQKQKELNNLKSRFQELADSKETSEVLNKIIENLQQEKSDLNQRLQELEVLKRQVNKLDFENSELKKRLHQYEDKFEDIPALKRHMNTLQSDNDELNLKLQEYAAELEGIPSLKRRIENLQTENAELEKRGKHKDGLLQKSESTVQKMQKDNQKLQTEIISQNQNYDTLKIKLESLKDKNLELDERLRRRSPVVVAEPKNCQNCFKYRNDISDLKREINDLRDRLSEAAGNKLRDNNPNIADLSDMNRPTSLAEKFSSLYTDEYTDAMEVIEDDMDEAASVKVMLDWLKSCYDWCQRLAKEQRETLINRSIGFMQEHGGQKVVLSDRCLIFVKEFQKKIAVESLAVVGQICHVKSVTQQTLSSEKYIVKYIKKCSELCWMMQISDPPLYLNFDVNSGENLNKNDYNVFTKSGSKIDYLVWPVLYLHKTGPMLAKGVAQGK